ncbi:MAG: response regulator [Candidatus Scalindua sp.]
MEEKKIILVEDDPDHADLIAEVLDDEGIERNVILVRDGMDAIDCFQELSAKWNGQMEHRIRMILLDLNLPKIDGMDILKFLKKNPRYSKIPVVILSTSSDEGTINEAYKNGADDFLTKPLSYEEFVVKLKGLKEQY